MVYYILYSRGNCCRGEGRIYKYCQGNYFRGEGRVYCKVKETVTDEKVGFTIQSRKLLQMRRYGLLYSQGNCYRWEGMVYYTVEETVIDEEVGFTVQSRKLL